MRQALVILAVSRALFSCNNAATTNPSGDTTITTQQKDAASTKSQRYVVIEELKRLQTVFSSKDKQKIADIFTFPAADSILGIFIDDSTYSEQFRKNNNTTTREMFIKYFPQVARDMQFDNFNQLFKYININSLNRKDSLVYEVKSSKEPCYEFYHVYINKDVVTLEFGSNTNENYTENSKKGKNDEGFEDECEYLSMWIFHFDGKKLHFVKQMAAG